MNERFDIDAALGEMLLSGPVFASDSGTASNPSLVTLDVICNDTFGYACADGVDLPYDEVENLYKLWKAYPIYGPTKWCCLQAKCRPLPEIEADLRKAGLWDAAMDALPPRKTPTAI